MPPQTPEKETSVKGYSATHPVVLDAANVDGASLAEAAEAYQRDGYFIARGLFSPEEVADINALFHKMHADGGVLGFYGPGKPSPAETKITTEKEDPLVVWTRVMHLHRFNEKARAYMLHPKVRVYLEKFMGGDPVATQSMFFLRPLAHAVKPCTKTTFIFWLNLALVWPHGLRAMTATPKMAT